jgi:branched-chain amino acid transport system permease protein
MDWDLFTQLTVNGLTLGSVYAMIALGYSLVYGILKLLNFAHGDVFMVGSFIGFGALQLLGGSADPAVPTWLLLTLITLAAVSRSSGLPTALCETPRGSRRSSARWASRSSSPTRCS